MQTENLLEMYIDRQIAYKNESFALWTSRFDDSITLFDESLIEKLSQSDLRLLDDDYSVVFDYVRVPSGSFIYNRLNDFILKCYQHGFIKHFQVTNLPKSSLPLIEDPKKVLTMHMLSAGFALWLCCVAVACCVFFIEHTVRYFTRTRKNTSKTESIEVHYELTYDVDRRRTNVMNK